MPLDKLRIRDISLYAQIGVYSWEKSCKQKLNVSLIFYFQPSEKQINIHQTINYDKLCQSLQQYQYQKFDLIENFANTLALNLLKQYPILQKVKVNVHKKVILKGLPSHVSFEILRQAPFLNHKEMSRRKKQYHNP